MLNQLPLNLSKFMTGVKLIKINQIIYLIVQSTFLVILLQINDTDFQIH